MLYCNYFNWNFAFSALNFIYTVTYWILTFFIFLIIETMECTILIVTYCNSKFTVLAPTIPWLHEPQWDGTSNEISWLHGPSPNDGATYAWAPSAPHEHEEQFVNDERSFSRGCFVLWAGDRTTLHQAWICWAPSLPVSILVFTVIF